MEQSIFVLLPLLIIILASDSVCGEFSTKTIKVLLTRATPRWKVLLSKYLALLILFSIVILEMAVLSLLISGFLFNNWGFYEPVATGFNSSIWNLRCFKCNKSNSITIFNSCILTWVVCLYYCWNNFIYGFCFSKKYSHIYWNNDGYLRLVEAFFKLFLADWPIIKYFFVINLNLPQYLTGSYTPISGMSLIFSTLVLLTWGICAFIISFVVFTKQDVLV